MQAGSLFRGDELRRNYVPNPGFEAGISGTTTGVNVTVSTGSDALQGSASMMVSCTSGTYQFVALGVTVPAGYKYVKFRAAVKHVSGDAGYLLRLGYRDDPTTGTLTLTPIIPAKYLAPGWDLVNIEAVIPDTTRFIQPMMYGSDGGSGVGTTGYVHLHDTYCMTLGQGPGDTPDPAYFDGDSSDTSDRQYEWVGEPNASVSVEYQQLSADVLEYSSHILVNGAQRPVISWNVSRDISSDLPAGVVGGTGVKQATGSIEWAESDDVADGRKNPWNPSTGWIPAEGDSVEIWAGNNTTLWRQFKGVIDKSSGTIGGGLQSQIIDRTDDTSVRASLPALVDVMPPTLPTRNWRRFRLTPLWAVMMCLRRAGFYATPATEANTAVDVPAFGGMWHYVAASMISCQRNSDADQAPLTPYGTHIADVYARYEPVNPKTGNVGVQLTMRVAAQHAGVASLMAMYGSSFVTLRATASSVIFMIGGTTIATVPRSGAVVVQAYFTNGSVRLRTSTGEDVTGTGSWAVTEQMSEVRIICDASSVVNGFIVSHPTSEASAFRNLDWAPTANIVSGNMHAPMAGLHATRAKTVRQVLDEIAEAMLWPYWIDENGVMQAIASDMLRSGSSVRTVTTLDDITEMSWERDLLGIRKNILTTFERITVNRRKDFSMPVWEQGDSVVLQSGESYEAIIDPGPEEWLMVDTAWKTIVEVSQLNKGVGTWLGGVYTDGTTDQWTNADSTVQANFAFTPIGDGTYKVSVTARTLESGKQVELRSVRGDFTGTTVLWPFWWDKNLPIVRAKGKFVTNDVTQPAVTASGKGAVLEHHTGLWATGNNAPEETLTVDKISAFLAEQTSSPHPKITGMRIVFDPRLQLGDVITVSSRNFLGVTLTCLIVGKNTAGTSDKYEMSIDVRVISVQTEFTTWAEWESSIPNDVDYAALEAIWPNESTYNDFNNDPLRGFES